MISSPTDHLLPNLAVEGVERQFSINENVEALQSTDKDDSRKIRRKCLWNLFVFSLCYFLVYTGFWSIANLESTMNSAGGLGDESQAAIYICSMISSLFLPKWMIERFGCKKVLVCGTLICSLYLASNLLLRWETLMPASVLFGLINGPFVASQTVYIDELATRFQSALATENIEFIMALFFGLFVSFSEMTQVLGNLLSYFILRTGKHDPGPGNVSLPTQCGIHFHPTENDTNSNLDPPTEEQRLLLVGSYTLIGLSAVFILIFFLDPLGNDLKAGSGCRSILDRVLSAVKHLTNVQQVLLIPISVLIGMEGPLYTNEVTEAYIACSWGVHHVGFVTVCFGVCGAITSLLVGPMVKYFSQMAVILLAACANVSICVVLFLWEPSPEHTTVYFVIAGVWGMGDAIWWSQITALYGLMFPDNREAAFSNLYFWSFLGFFLSYSYANYLSVAVKINILLCFLISGIGGYLIGQIKIKCTARNEYIALVAD